MEVDDCTSSAQPEVRHPGDRRRQRHQQPDRHQHLDVLLVADLPHGSPERDRRVRRCHGGSQNNGTSVQQYATWNGAPQAFYLLASGSDWKITMGANQGKCLGPNNNGTGNSTTIVVRTAMGARAQSYTAMQMSTSGVYAFKNVASGRCLNIAGNTTANGALLARRLRRHPRHQRPVQRPVSANLEVPPRSLHQTTAGPPRADRPFPFGRPAGIRPLSFRAPRRATTHRPIVRIAADLLCGRNTSYSSPHRKAPVLAL